MGINTNSLKLRAAWAAAAQIDSEIDIKPIYEKEKWKKIREILSREERVQLGKELNEQNWDFKKILTYDFNKYKNKQLTPINIKSWILGIPEKDVKQISYLNKFLSKIDNQANNNLEKYKEAICLAIEKDDLEIFKFFLEKTFRNVHSKNEVMNLFIYNYNLFNRKIDANNHNILNYLINQKFTQNNHIALHSAIKYGKSDLVDVLLDNGADVNARNANGETPVFIFASCKKFNRDIWAKLMAKDANIYLKENRNATLLHYAVNFGHVELANELILRGLSINSKYDEGKTALMLACEKSDSNFINTTTFDLLLNSCTDINDKDIGGRTIVHKALQLGCNKFLIEKLIAKGADFQVINDQDGNTPLHYLIEGIWNDRLNWEIFNHILKKLITEGTDVNLVDNEGNTPLHYFLKGMHKIYNHDRIVSIFETLIDAGADVNVANKEGDTPLHFLFKTISKPKKQSLNSEKIIFEKLIDKKININAVNKEGNTPLHIAVKNNYSESLEIFFNNKADIHKTNKNGKTAFDLAIRYKNKNILKVFAKKLNDGDILNLLIKDHKGINEPINDDNDTALHLAFLLGKRTVIQTLLEKKANNEAKNKNNTIPADIKYSDETNSLMHIAVENKNLDLLRILLDNKANIHETNKNGKTAFDIALIYINEDIFNVFAKKLKDEDIVKLLIKDHIDINEPMNNYNTTALMAAAMLGNKNIILKLIDLKANINAKQYYNNKKSALHFAAEFGKVEAIKVLIENGADLNEKDENDNIVLHLAAKNGKADAIKALIEHGADLNKKDIDGNTALHLAAKNGKADAIKVLIENGADLKEKNIDDNTALHLGIINNTSDEIIKLLIGNKEVLKIKNNNGCTSLDLAIFYKRFDIIKILLDNGAIYNEDISVEKLIELVSGMEIVSNLLILQSFTLIKQMLDDPDCPNVIKKLISEDLNNAIDNILNIKEYTPDNILERIKKGETTIINATAEFHIFHGLFYKGYLLFFNRGKGRKKSSITMIKLSEEGLNLDKLNKLLDYKIKIEEKYELIDTLGEKDKFCEALEAAAKHKDQKTSNCTWVGPKLLTITMLFLPKFLNEKNKHKSKDQLVQEFDLEFQTTGKFFSAQIRNYITIIAKSIKAPVSETLINKAEIKNANYFKKHNFSPSLL